ncbi:unnamed protein product [Didymodactylos carnosus]|uniref:Amino acid permease/ SLC12A domain-containing protein n=1 Tax=Didymodactylos carnosus TaxID=1234261 RepID=A0A8S2EE19_9BILA|nr:unnamed protein product [Didymodactylos carnosus]CAF4012213.1 unnamed protein product [Didymodactylos carnosus]
MPTSGSAYTYVYTTAGEFFAWIVGWELLLEYLVSAAAISTAWAGYSVHFVQITCNYIFPARIVNAPINFNETNFYFYLTGNIINLPAIVIVVALTTMLMITPKYSMRLVTVFVAISVTILTLFVVSLARYTDQNNYHPFFSKYNGNFNSIGISGMLHGTTVVFFAYIGYDVVTTASEDAKDPKKTIKYGVMGSLLISTVIYLLVIIVLIGIVPYTQLNDPYPLAFAPNYNGMKWLSITMAVGAVCSTTSALLVQLIAQLRIFVAMARDKLLPKTLENKTCRTITTGNFCPIYKVIIETSH